MILALLAAVGLVLLIACTNLASLLLGRLTRRSREFAIRTAMGSSRWRLVRQMIVETSLLALIGGGLGVLIAMWGTRVILLHWPPRTLRPDAAGLDSHVLLFILGVTIFAVLLYGLAPAIRATHWNASEILKEAATQSTDSVATGRMHTFFVVAQTALATILLINSGLMLKSLRTLLSVDPGFGAERVLAMNISLPIRQYPTESKWQIFYTQFLERIRALPGVRDAGMVLNLPVGGGNSSGDFLIEGRPKFSAGQVNVQKQIASPGYFEAMGIRLVRGRFFSERDAADAPPVVLISESMARHFWPNEDPVGKRMDLQYGSVKGWQEIAGVVGDVKSDGLEFASPGHGVFVFAAKSKPGDVSRYPRSGESRESDAGDQERTAHAGFKIAVIWNHDDDRSGVGFRGWAADVRFAGGHFCGALGAIGGDGSVWRAVLFIRAADA